MARSSQHPTSKRILILGGTGYVGGRLVPELLEAGHEVRCLARTPAKLDNRPWRAEVGVVEGDLLEPASLDPAFADIDVAYYLVHSLGVGDGFEELEQRCARNTAAAAAGAGLEQVVYLGGLGDEDDESLSPHLRSRHEVGRILAAGATPVTELRAAVILGSGSASFEMLRGLTEVLPVMTTPRWVQRTRCQPISIRDVLRDLIAVLGRVDLAGVWEIGGPNAVTYQEMMETYAEVAELAPRLILPVPVLTPRLSAKWIGLVTDLPPALATELVGSLLNDVVADDRPLDGVLDRQPLELRPAIEAALSAVQDLDVPTRWTGGTARSAAAKPKPWDPDWSGGTVLEDRRTMTIAAPPKRIMAEVRKLGGEESWLGYDVLWDLRGIGDLLVGGDGRRTRRHPTDLAVGDVVDMFRVEVSTDSALRLRAEMRMPGYGWLEWAVEDGGPDDGATSTTLVQHARFVPKGVLGRAYWLALVPFHGLLFGRMLTNIADRVEGVDEAGPPVAA